MALKEIHRNRLSTDLGRLEENWVIKDGKDEQGNEIHIEGDAEHPSICGQPVGIQTVSTFFTSNPLEEKITAPKCNFALQRRFELVSGEGKLSSFTEDGKRIEEAYQTKTDGKKICLGDKVLPPKSLERGIVIGLIPHSGKRICYAVVKVGIDIKLVNINVLGL